MENKSDKKMLNKISPSVDPWETSHCVKSVQIRRFFWSVFSVCSPNTGKYGPKKTPYLDTFHGVLNIKPLTISIIYTCSLFSVWKVIMN